MPPYTQGMRALGALALVTAAVLFGQSAGTAPKDKPVSYPAHTTVGDIAIGADYLVHSIPANSQTFFAPDYLVVEVAVFPKRGSPTEIAISTFTLRVNGKKQVLYSDSTGMVAASIKYPDWEQRKNLEVGASVGDAGVIIGRPPVVGRFPDDPRQQQTRLPRPPKAPDAQQGVEREEPEDLDTALIRTALPQGAVSIPVSGYLYFRYQGKTKSIKSVELLYQGPAGTATLKLL